MKDPKRFTADVLYGLFSPLSFPTTLDRATIERNPTSTGFHESLLRSYHVIEGVRLLCESGASSAEILAYLDAFDRVAGSLANGAHV